MTKIFAVLAAALLSSGAYAQSVPSARPPTLGTGLTNASGTCNTGTQQAVGNIVPQTCAQAYTSGPHSVSLADGVGLYEANGGSAITFTLARANGGTSDGAQGVGFCFADLAHHGYTLSTTTSTFTGGPGISGTSVTFPADTFVCAAANGSDLWTVEVIFGDAARQSAANTFTAANSFAEVHGTKTAPSLTSNNYSAVVADCGTTVFLPTGTTPTVTLPNLSAPPNNECHITFVTGAAISYHFIGSGSGVIENSQAFSNTRGTNVGDAVSAILRTPSGSAAHWVISGDLTS